MDSTTKTEGISNRPLDETDLSRARIDEAVIALRLGHESPNITHRYVEADLAIKREALARLEQSATFLLRCCPLDALMAFLQQL